MASCNDSSRNNLDLLPPEIQVHILSSLPDIRTLLALLGASPRFLQVFQQAREEIVSRVVCSHISLVILPLALDVLQQQGLRGNRRQRSDVLAFLDTFKQRKTSPSYRFPLEISKQLLKLHYTVEYFIEDFTQSRLSIISAYLERDYFSLTEKRNALDIPSIERNRLARAFYYLELYGSVFYDPESPDGVLTVTEQSSLFLARLTDWELEEFQCVRLYLIDSLSIFLDHAEDDYLQFYSNLGPTVYTFHPPPDRLSEYDSRWENGEEWYFFSKDGADAHVQEGWLERSLTRGLREIKTMLAADTSEERDEHLGETDVPRSTMAQALAALPSLSKQAKNEWLAKCANSGLESSLDNPNEAWFWALRGGVHPREYATEPWRQTAYNSQNPTNRGMLGWGYVIWDNETLNTLQILGKSPYDVSRYYRDKYERSLKHETVEDRSRKQWLTWRDELLAAKAMDRESETGMSHHVALLYQGWENKRNQVFGVEVEDDEFPVMPYTARAI